MTSSRTIFACLAAPALATALAGCKEKRDPGFQGWVEADMIFVSPDEAGRVTKLNIREGDEVKVGDPSIPSTTISSLPISTRTRRRWRMRSKPMIARPR